MDGEKLLVLLLLTASFLQYWQKCIRELENAAQRYLFGSAFIPLKKIFLDISTNWTLLKWEARLARWSLIRDEMNSKTVKVHPRIGKRSSKISFQISFPPPTTFHLHFRFVLNWNKMQRIIQKMYSQLQWCQGSFALLQCIAKVVECWRKITKLEQVPYKIFLDMSKNLS